MCNSAIVLIYIGLVFVAIEGVLYEKCPNIFYFRREFQCDGDRDCPNGLDELNCTSIGKLTYDLSLTILGLS